MLPRKEQEGLRERNSERGDDEMRSDDSGAESLSLFRQELIDKIPCIQRG